MPLSSGRARRGAAVSRNMWEIALLSLSLSFFMHTVAREGENKHD